MEPFYHSAYTSNGFKHIRLNSVNPDSFRYILKGNSEQVKHNLFQKIADTLNKRDKTFVISRNYNGKISALKCESEGFIICDGTHPFFEEADTFGAVDGIISLESFQNRKMLKAGGDRIISLINAVNENERRCKRFLAAAEGLNRDKKRIEKDNLDSRKISRYSAKMWSLYGCAPSGKVGVETKVFATVPYSDGVKSCDNNLSELCDTAIVIDSESGCCSEMIIDRIRRYALSSGNDIVSCQSFIDSEGVPEHIIVPALRFGVFTKQKELNPECVHIKKVRGKRFNIEEIGENTKVRLQFNQKAYDSLMKEVSESIRRIDILKSQLDEIFVEATNEKALYDFLMSELLK